MSDTGLLEALCNNIPIVDYLNAKKVGVNNINRIKEIYMDNKSEKELESIKAIQEYEDVLQVLACISHMYENSVEFSTKVDMRGLTKFSPLLELKLEVNEHLGTVDILVKNSGFYPAFYPTSESFRFTTYLLPPIVQNFIFLLKYFPSGLEFMNIRDAIDKRIAYDKKINVNELLCWYNTKIFPTIRVYRIESGSKTDGESSKSPSINESEQLVNSA